MIPPLLEGAAAGLPEWVKNYALRENLFSPGDRVLVAVSGGPDSVALLHLLHRLRNEWGLQLGVAHFDHGLRGEESRGEARFTASLAQSLSLPFHGGEGDTAQAAKEERLSLQMAARRLRFEFFRDTCRQGHYQKLALGHTADDQVELFFLRLLRGAGPEGLRGMPASTPEGLVRPLLSAGKEVILGWLRRENLPFRQDPSNLKRDYLRNRVRLDLLPFLRQFNPRPTEAVWRAQALLQEDAALLEPLAAEAGREAVATLAPGLYRVHAAKLLALPRAMQKLALRPLLHELAPGYPLSAAQVEGVLELAQAKKSGGSLSLGDCRVARAGGELHLFSRVPDPPPESGWLPSSPGRFEALGWNWRVSYPPSFPEKPRHLGPNLAFLDRDRLHFPLEVRYFRPGDRFWPQGAPGGKKLQDFLVDRKIPRWLRPYLPLVLSRGEIIWVAGLRIADPAKVTANTQNLLEIELTPGPPDTRRIWQMFQAITA